MLCPVCQVELAMTERQGIEVDYCPKCRGVWLDRGELDKILERSASEEQPRAAVQGGEHHGSYDSRHGRHPRKRKSLLSELFDL